MSLKDYHESISNELIAVATRVRQFVKHWGEDGKHHEAVLKNVLRNFLPRKYEIGSGFVIKPKGERGTHEVSKQIDLIIYDSNFPTFFREGDFVITTPDAVKGIISVKANLENQNSQKTYDDCNFNGSFIHSGKKNKSEELFNGLFSYDGFNSEYLEFNEIEKKLQTSFDTFYIKDWKKENINSHALEKNYILNHISINKNYFVKHWNSRSCGNQEYVFYNLQNLSYSYFISNLMEYLTSHNETVDHDNYLWYPTNKSELKIKTFSIIRPR